MDNALETERYTAVFWIRHWHIRRVTNESILSVSYFTQSHYFITVQPCNPIYTSIEDILAKYTWWMKHFKEGMRQKESLLNVNLISVVPCIMLNSEINPTRCNNCVYSSQWLYSGPVRQSVVRYLVLSKAIAKNKCNCCILLDLFHY